MPNTHEWCKLDATHRDPFTRSVYCDRHAIHFAEVFGYDQLDKIELHEEGPPADRVEAMVHAFSDKERRQAVRDLADAIRALQQTIDSQRREAARIVGLLRCARELIWNHHAEGIMEPDSCPLCQPGGPKEWQWLFEQMKEVLE